MFHFGKFLLNFKCILHSCVIFAEHVSPLYEQIAKLEEALYNIQFEQHWLEAETDRQAISMSFGNLFFKLLNSLCISTLKLTLCLDSNSGVKGREEKRTYSETLMLLDFVGTYRNLL